MDSLIVEIRNEGNALANDVRLVTPPGFERIAPFDLAPGETKRIPVSAKRGRAYVREASDAISVDYDPTTGVPDTAVLIKLGWGMLVVILFAVVKDVRRLALEGPHG